MNAKFLWFRFEFKTYLHGQIVPEKCIWMKLESGVRLVLRKQVETTWNRLIQSPYKYSWLSRDFDILVDESDEEGEQVPLVDPRKYPEDFDA